METDEITPVILDDSSSESDQAPEVSEDVKTPEEAVPYSRFKEVIDQKNEFKTRLESLEKNFESFKQPVAEPEPETWQDVKKMSVQEAKEQIKAELQAEKDKKTAEEQEIDRSFERIEKFGQKITPDIKKAVLTKMIRTGSNVFDSYLEVKQSLDKESKATQLKNESKTPTSQKGSEATPTFDYNSIKGKSPVDIAREAGLI